LYSWLFNDKMKVFCCTSKEEKKIIIRRTLSGRMNKVLTDMIKKDRKRKKNFLVNAMRATDA